MGKWKNVRIGEFLTERQGRYKPDDNAIVTYKRLDKIDFSGTIHISEKPSKTDMIIVQPGDLVISGTNVAKGAIAVYQGVEPVTATIHYSSYIFDDSVVDLEYFKYFVKSPAFIETLKKQAKGGIKTEIKSKVFLPLEISLPDLPTQKQIVKRISVNLKRVNELAKEIETQKGYAKQLRRNILQDAIEGKLTADWRKDNPVQKGNPDYDAEALFESIQKERKVDKKRKTLPPILDAEKPFELPTGWKWVRLGDVSDNIEAGKSILCKEVVPCGDEAGIVKTGVCSYGCFKEDESKTCLSEKDWRDEYAIHVDDFLIGRANTLELVGSCVIVDKLKKRLMLSDKILRINFYKQFKNQLLLHFMRTKFLRSQIEKTATGSSPTMKNISQSSINNYILPLLPLAEQEQIVDIVSGIFDIVSKIEQQILRREEYANQLMKNIVKDALEGR
jgi:type-1 restriction enzyme ecoEI specificity protein